MRGRPRAAGGLLTGRDDENDSLDLTVRGSAVTEKTGAARGADAAATRLLTALGGFAAAAGAALLVARRRA